jgi:hypothetical protein
MLRQMVQHRTHYVFLPRLTNVGGAQAHGLGPEFVIRQSMGANDAKCREFVMQAFDFT